MFSTSRGLCSSIRSARPLIMQTQKVFFTRISSHWQGATLNPSLDGRGNL